MTDNRTTELLRKLLEERNEHYVHDEHTVTWSYYTDPHTATESMDGTLIVTGLTPEQAIAATLGSEREIELGDALNEVAEKWAIAQVEAENYAKRCMLLEELVRDAYWLIARAVWTHVSQDKFAADWTERVSVLGIEVE